MNDNDLLMEHEADGIRELDNKLPRWWVWLFHLTIVFSVAYMAYYHLFKSGPLQAAAYAIEMERGDQLKNASIARFESSFTTLTPEQDPVAIAQGASTFKTLCAPCHREDGGGLVGPNLTDDYWIHGDSFEQNLKVVWNGVPEKGMVSWKGVLQPRDIHLVTSYIQTLRGSNPPNPKPPENTLPADEGPSEFE